ncbi:hypothetical protein BGW38_009295 [Lunasporangiospora selenospora]|uniref:RING-type domain-containing protein n=1 Tax=Lunasporangiospora selenospora TaxID=979761 RepID=A0A9P6FXU7_9FUNG|nr:hypothetical protein BGW38_009295 [Lunasporangiospora selenospora]
MGSGVCENCCTYRTKLPQFGHTTMDYTGLSQLNIKTLRGYLLSYNISTSGMLEKQDLIRAIQSHHPIPEASEVYFRKNQPPPPERSGSFLDGFSDFGRSDSPSGSSTSSGGKESTSEGWISDIDRFFSKLFGGDDSTPSETTRSRSQAQPRQPPPSSTSPNPRPQPWAQAPSGSSAPGANYGRGQPSTGSTYGPYFGVPLSPATAFSQARAQSMNNTTSSTNGTNSTSASASGSFTPRPQAPTQQPRTTPPSTQSTQPRATPPSAQSTQPQPSSAGQPVKLTDLISSNINPTTLSVKAIKGLLDDSCVSYVGVVEKQDLVDRLEKLIENTRAEQNAVQEQEAASKKKTSAPGLNGSGGGSGEDDNLCKICCDAALNCVMLNCNHMSTCMDCGKLIMEGSRMCPICREYIVKLLHVFRA